MTKEEIMEYVLETPYNVNPAILSQKIDEYAGENSGTNESLEDKSYAVIEFELTNEEVVITADGVSTTLHKAVPNYSFNEYFNIMTSRKPVLIVAYVDDNCIESSDNDYRYNEGLGKYAATFTFDYKSFTTSNMQYTVIFTEDECVYFFSENVPI